MKPPIKSPQKLLEQLEDNSAGLIRADLKLRASHEHRAELARSYEKQMASTRRMEQLILLLLLLACLLGFAYLLYLLFPYWLPEQWAAFSSFIEQLWRASNLAFG